jgi:hypothetical protein
MTLATFAPIFQPAMEAPFPIDILADFLVAILAELGLRSLIEAFVTLGAIFFPFCVALDHLAGHQCRLDAVGSGECRGP